MGPVLEVGDRFIRQVYILTICFTIVIAAVLLGFKRPLLPSFLIGSAISLSLFWSMEFAVRRFIQPGKTKHTKSLLGFIAFGKYIVLGGLLYLLFKMEWLNIYALAGGIVLVQLAIIIKAVGLLMPILMDAFSNKDSDQL